MITHWRELDNLNIEYDDRGPFFISLCTESVCADLKLTYDQAIMTRDFINKVESDRNKEVAQYENM